jgi:hypothetical protein
MGSVKSFAASIVNARKNIFFIQAEQAEGSAWYYVRIHSGKLPLFTKKLGREAMTISEYGDILCSGWGEQPALSMRPMLESMFADG